MTPTTFTLTVLGLYAAYYGVLFLSDHLSRRRSTSSADTLYTLAPGTDPPLSPTVAKDRLMPETYLPVPIRQDIPPDEDSDLGIEYLSDDGIEATDENLAALLGTPKHP
jgi:hypothetical protein